MSKRAKVTGKAKTKAETKAKTKVKAKSIKPKAFKTLKAAARAIKRKAKKPTEKPAKKLDRDTPAQPDAMVTKIIASGGARMEHPKGFSARPVNTRWLHEIIVGKRHRKDFGNLKELAASIDDRGELIQSIAIQPDNMLIAGERRMKAWPLTRFKDRPIPVRVITVDSIIAGEWDENAKRKDFTPTEAAKISEEIERQLATMAHARQHSGKKADPAQKGASSDLAARATGKARRTIDKAKAVVKAAESDPQRFGRLQADMDRSGKVDGPFKRLQVMQQTEALRKAPPPLPMRGPYMAMLVDFPVTGDVDKDQETIDATGRSFRGYPEMSIEECGVFARKQLLPILAPDCSVWLTFPNFHIVNGSAHKIIAGFGPEFTATTMLTWKKDKLGRGKILRDQTEHAIVIYRGKPTFNALGEDPPTTFLDAARRENSRKPDELYDRVERVCPAPRYAEIFSRGGRNEKWDCHGDQVGKFAPAVAKEAQDAVLREIQLTPDQQMFNVLSAIEKGEPPDLRLIDKSLAKQLDKCIEGTKKFKLTASGKSKLADLREAAQDAAIAATLPDGQQDLAEAYRQTIADFEQAIRDQDKAAAETNASRAEIILRKVNGVDSAQWFFDAENAGKAGQVIASAAAPVGEVPAWGRNGLFKLTVDEIDYLVLVHWLFDSDGACGDITLYPTDKNKPWVNSQSDIYGGLRKIQFDDDIKPGADIAALCAQRIRDEVAESLESLRAFGPKRKKGEPAPQLAPAKHMYALPASWNGISEPKRVSGKAADSPPAVRKPTTVRRTTRGRDAALIEWAENSGHVVSMTNDGATANANGIGDMVGTCACGERWQFSRRQHKAMDAAITAHWRAIYDQEQDAGLANSLASDAESPPASDRSGTTEAQGIASASADPAPVASGGGADGMPSTPAFLRRNDDNSVPADASVP
jgi:N6-adenosine-specific RNA methylase IME4